MNKQGFSTLDIYKQKLIYFNYSQNTIDLYCGYVCKFLATRNKSQSNLTAFDFTEYLNTYQFTSVSQQNQIINAIKFLYDKVLERKYQKVDFERPRGEKKLPQVIDHDLIVSQLNKITNLKHQLILSLAYSVGLRVSEVVNLKLDCIDFERELIYIKNGKGRKDRIVPLSKSIAEKINKYKLAYAPQVYLFNGQNDLQYSVKSCQMIFKKYIDENSHFHILRHSCFTHLLESGTDLRVIQKIAGHKKVTTTEIYTHVSNKLLSKIHLPV